MREKWKNLLVSEDNNTQTASNIVFFQYVFRSKALQTEIRSKAITVKKMSSYSAVLLVLLTYWMWIKPTIKNCWDLGGVFPSLFYSWNQYCFYGPQSTKVVNNNIIMFGKLSQTVEKFLFFFVIEKRKEIWESSAKLQQNMMKRRIFVATSVFASVCLCEQYSWMISFKHLTLTSWTLNFPCNNSSWSLLPCFTDLKQLDRKEL